MIGITGYGTYIPFYRLEKSEIGSFWGTPGQKGEKSVANFDEDSITMAVEACRNCIRDSSIKKYNSLYLASASLPFAEKQNSSIVASALDMQNQTFTADITGSLKGGTSALLQAVEHCGNNDNSAEALVAAADMRISRPFSSIEMNLGDGAAALAVGKQNILAAIEGTYSSYQEIYDTYRPAEEKFIQNWEDRFRREKGYIETTLTAIKEALNKWNMQAEDFQRIVLSAPNPSYLKKPLKNLNIDPKTQHAGDPLFEMIGFTGTAHPFLLLCSALENSQPEERILFAAYGDGCNVISLKTTELVEKLKERTKTQTHIESKRITTYQKYLRWRNLVDLEPPKRPKQESASSVALYRDQKCGMAFYGSKCKNCGRIQYPVQRICMNCREKDNFEYYPLSDKKGYIVTFSHDYLAVSPDPPTTLAAVNFELGGRVMLDITDREPEQVTIGTVVEPTFRKFRQTEGVQVYWWKARPIR